MNGRTVTSETDIANELGQVWARTFSKVEGVPPQAFDFLRKFCSPWDFANILPPSVGDFDEFIKSLKDSAPGPDGIPYSCYKALSCFLPLFSSKPIEYF